MYALGNIIIMLDRVLDSRRKRHILGGFLISGSLLFAGLAFTVMTIKKEDDPNDTLRY